MTIINGQNQPIEPEEIQGAIEGSVDFLADQGYCVFRKEIVAVLVKALRDIGNEDDKELIIILDNAILLTTK